MRIGPYTLREKLGEGGMGEVHLAHDARLGREVALKILPSALRDDTERRTRFLHEARIVAQLSHPNITQIFEVGESDGTDFLAFEFVAGSTLAELLERGPLDVARIVELALPLADALSYAHERGVLHRDLKPANVMITTRGHAKLLDFGLAKLLQQGSEALTTKATTLTIQGAICGTPTAMSPEQALGKPLDARSDVFSFGSLLYELAGGRPAFAGTTAVEVLDAVIHDEALPLGRVRPEIPQEFVAIVEKAMRKDPAERYQALSELTADLRHLRRTTEMGVVPPGDGRRLGVRRVALVVCVVAALGFLAWAQWGRRPPSGVEAGPGRPPLLAVVGFENLIDLRDEDALGRMLTGLVATDLAERGGVRVVSTSKVLASLERVRGGSHGRFELATAMEVARDVEASLMLVGQVARAGTGLLLTAELVEVKSGETQGSVRAEAPSVEKVFALAERVAASVRAHLGMTTTPGHFELASLTRSQEAYRQFSAGELAMHNRNFVLARKFFERAVEADADFAMAWFRLGLTKSWLDGEIGVADFERAILNSGRLSARWRAVVAGAIARGRGDYDTAYETLLPLVEASVEIPEAHNEFGEVLTHAGRYRNPTLARRSFQRALEINPRFELVSYHLMNELFAAEDLVGAKALLADITHGGRTVYGSVALPLAERRYPDAIAVARAELEASGQTDWESYLIAARLSDNEALFSSVAEAWRAAVAGERHWQQTHLAMQDYRHGRFHGAFAALDRAVRLNPMRYVQVWVSTFKAMFRFGMGDDSGAESAARETIEHDRFDFTSWFLLGTAQVRMRQISEARDTLGQARRLLNQSKNALGASLLDCLEAEIAAAVGNHDQAAAAIVRSRSRPPESRQRECELIAAAQVATAARDVEAARAAWRELVTPTYPRHTDSLDCDVWPLYEWGRCEHEHGDPAVARDLLQRFLGYWGDADRSLPLIQDARARLRALER